MIRIGLVGYGTGGQHFHAPFIQAAEGVELVGIVARSPGRIAAVKADFPDMPIYDSLTSMIASGKVDAVTITTPPHTRKELVLEAIESGIHVIADKPFAPNAQVARELTEAARSKGVELCVFHNRRFDTDIQTLKQVMDSGKLGKIWRLSLRMEQDDPVTLEAGPQGGLLRDLGSHVVDQAIFLLGPITSVYAQLDDVDLPEGRTNAAFSLTLMHESGAHSHISCSKINRQVAKEFLIHADNGSYFSQATDVQAQDIFAGKRPIDDMKNWGYEAEENWPTLAVGKDAPVKVPSAQGRYHDYYEMFAKTLTEGAEPPVTLEQAIQVLEVIDAAAVSAKENKVVSLSS